MRILIGSPSFLSASLSTHPPFLFFLSHYLLISYSLFSSSSPCLSLLLHHFPPLASMPPRIPIFFLFSPLLLFISFILCFSSSSYTSFSSFLVFPPPSLCPSFLSPHPSLCPYPSAVFYSCPSA